MPKTKRRQKLFVFTLHWQRSIPCADLPLSGSIQIVARGQQRDSALTKAKIEFHHRYSGHRHIVRTEDYQESSEAIG